MWQHTRDCPKIHAMKLPYDGNAVDSFRAKEQWSGFGRGSLPPSQVTLQALKSDVCLHNLRHS